MAYDPNNWYWLVLCDDTQVFYSGTGQKIPLNDETYTAWLEIEKGPSKIGTWEELYDVLKNQAPDALDRGLEVITNNNISPQQKRERIEHNGLTISCVSNESLNGTYPINVEYISKNRAILQSMDQNQVTQVGILDKDNSVHIVNSDELTKIIDALTNYVNAVDFAEAVALANNSQADWPEPQAEIQ